jgi:hypothetical protein
MPVVMQDEPCAEGAAQLRGEIAVEDNKTFVVTLSKGLIAVGRDPLTLGTDHYGTAFIELTNNGVSELRSDADDIAVLLRGGPAKKRQALSRIFTKEKPFVDSLLHAGTSYRRTSG